MASTNLEVVISATDRFTGTANRVIGKLGQMQGAAGRVGKGVGQLGAGLLRVGVIAAGAAAGGLVAATRVALNFQDAMAGVSKTVEGTPEDIAKIGRELLAISTTIPVAATDLAHIAEELGALGVPRDEIAETARVVAELSAATVGLTPEAAAEAFGKLGNVLKVHGKDVERFGSSLVALGNAGASSEGDIIQVATRFGAAGSQAKLSAAEVLGWSSAIASLGVEPEAAGSSLSRLFNNVTKYIGTGNDKIKAFAKTAGMSVKDFSRFFARDATSAMELFLLRLGEMDRFKASAVLKQAGINNVRDINAVLLLSQNYGELYRQVKLSKTAWQENTELQATAAKRFDSVKAKLTILGNTIKFGAITMANEFLPALGRTVTKLTDLLKLPSTQQDLKNLGQDIAAALDAIDWKQVLDGAKTFLDILKTIVSVVAKIPVQVDAAVVAFLGLNKLSGGLIGQGLGNIAGGLTQGIAAKLPGVGKLFAQPVYVVNWPLGGVGGGVGGGPAGAAGGGVVGTLGAALVVPTVVGAFAGLMDEFSRNERSRELSASVRGVAPTMNGQTVYIAGGKGGVPIPITNPALNRLSDRMPTAQDRANGLLAGQRNQLAILRDRIESNRIAVQSAQRGIVGNANSNRAATVGALNRLKAAVPKVIVNVSVNGVRRTAYAAASIGAMSKMTRPGVPDT